MKKKLVRCAVYEYFSALASFDDVECLIFEFLRSLIVWSFRSSFASFRCLRLRCSRLCLLCLFQYPVSHRLFLSWALVFGSNETTSFGTCTWNNKTRVWRHLLCIDDKAEGFSWTRWSTWYNVHQSLRNLVYRQRKRASSSWSCTWCRADQIWRNHVGTANIERKGR